jgi:cell division transport system permease protein
MLTTLSRIIKSGWLNFWRNKWLSVAAISVMGLTIFVMTSLLLVNVLINSLVQALRDKIDISVYFNLDAPEEQILEARSSLVELEEVKSVEYVSREEALKRFKERHQDNPLLMQSLQELESNPLEASLNIKAQTASQYEQIVNFLNQSQYQEIVDKINYRQNQAIIAKLSSITKAIQQSGLVVSVILALMTILVTFNTIRLAIYSAREEINVMRLVGASNWFIRGPFIVEGALYGFIAAIITLVVFFPLLWFLAPKITAYLPGADLFYFFQMNFWQILLLQIVIGISLGVASSLVAIRRYLKV